MLYKKIYTGHYTILYHQDKQKFKHQHDIPENIKLVIVDDTKLSESLWAVHQHHCIYLLPVKPSYIWVDNVVCIFFKLKSVVYISKCCNYKFILCMYVGVCIFKKINGEKVKMVHAYYNTLERKKSTK